MKCYCDTSVLASVYLADRHSTQITEWLQQAPFPLPLTPLLELELTSAIQQRLFRKKITHQLAIQCQQYLQDDLNQGVYQRVSFQQEEYSQALQLIRHHTALIGCRTLDVLHVAFALLLQTREFVTSDSRQKLLAETVGMKVKFFK